MRAPFAAILAWCKGEVIRASMNWQGLCQRFARTAVGAGAWATTARRAYEAIPAEHRHSGQPTPGAIVYFGKPGVDPGHATVASSNAWYVFSTDILRSGKVDEVPISLIVNKWGLPYRGWIDWTPSGPIALQKPEDVLHTIKIGGRTALSKSEVIRQSSMSNVRFNAQNPGFPDIAPAGTAVRVPSSVTAIYAGRDR